jgi:putative nucleotidyltransferase with HDIG domain
MENLLIEPDYTFEQLLSFITKDNSFYAKKLSDKHLLIKTLNNKCTCHIKHSKRVSKMVLKLAKQYGVEKKELKNIKLAALFHDIGKLAISEQILNSPRKLTEEEFQIIKQHSRIGCKLLRASQKLQQIAPYVLQHHERYDGTGYPNGLVGEHISLPARMITVVDSYDAMTSERPYRTPLPKQAAIAELRRCAGSQFDPQLVEIFIQKVLK